MQSNIIECLIRIIKSASFEMRSDPTGVSEVHSRFNGIKAVLFDVYGTLLISGSGDIGVASERSSGVAIRESLEAAGVHVVKGVSVGDRASRLLMNQVRKTHADLRRQGVAFPEVDIREVWRSVLGKLVDEGVARCAMSGELVMRLAVEYECRTNPVWPMSGVLELLQVLRARGVLLGLISNAQFYTPLLFPALLGASIDEVGFSQLICSWSYLLREAKPSVQLFVSSLGVLKRDFGIIPSEVVYVGNDMLNDILPSSAVGCRTVLFAGDKRSLRLREGEPRCAGVVPNAVVTDLRQLPDLLL